MKTRLSLKSAKSTLIIFIAGFCNILSNILLENIDIVFLLYGTGRRIQKRRAFLYYLVVTSIHENAKDMIMAETMSKE